MYNNFSNLKINTKFLLTLQLIVIGFLIYNMSLSLRAFIDEIVSLSSNINFWNNGFDFRTGNSNGYSSYSPKLTAGPISALGSSLSWNITQALPSIRIFNFVYVYLVQVVFCFFISKKHNFNFETLLIICGFIMTSIPWWYGTLYSLGEMISSILFFNSLILFNSFRRATLILMSISIFFGKFIFIICFLGFYISVLLNEKITLNILQDAFYFLIPLSVWLLLVYINYEQSLSSYFSEFLFVYFQQPELIGSFNFSLENIIKNLQSSEVSTWNVSIILRVLLSPILIIFLLIKKNVFGNNLDIHLLFSIGFIYLYFWLLNPKKSVIYTQDFTYITLMLGFVAAFSLINSSNKINKLISLLIISTFMSSNIIFFLLIIFILFITMKEINLNSAKSLLIIFLLVSQFNAFIESQEWEKNTYSIIECIENFNFSKCNSNGYN